MIYLHHLPCRDAAALYMIAFVVHSSCFTLCGYYDWPVLAGVFSDEFNTTLW